jgi:hypothetical protein
MGHRIQRRFKPGGDALALSALAAPQSHKGPKILEAVDALA